MYIHVYTVDKCSAYSLYALKSSFLPHLRLPRLTFSVQQG